ncbi:MAG: tRNA (adenosine(37)-N6)-threonylcarbamoyltransferase complex ATPase subunit type 1 TsaE [Acidimicrobiia bacterium]
MIEVSCPGPEHTLALASRVAPLVRPGDLIVLAGSLGAGKTLFAGGLASGLGVEETVVSPSFVLVRQYQSGFLPFVHADIYRLNSINEFEDLDVFEIARDGVLVIEWGDAIEATLPTDHLRVRIDVADEDTRIITFEPFGSWTERDWESVI